MRLRVICICSCAKKCLGNNITLLNLLHKPFIEVAIVSLDNLIDNTKCKSSIYILSPYRSAPVGPITYGHHHTDRRKKSHDYLQRTQQLSSTQ